ncbi:ATP-binding protein [Micromonospora zamorensis]|uniref:ATP-binding protein n=1 Tax=Micromonospora zamorensis TaxID=709883 RepID=UPI0033F3C3C7
MDVPDHALVFVVQQVVKGTSSGRLSQPSRHGNAPSWMRPSIVMVMPFNLTRLRRDHRWPWRGLAFLAILGLSGWWWTPPVVDAIASFVRADLAVKDSVSSVVSVAIGLLSFLTSTYLGWLQLSEKRQMAATEEPTSDEQHESHAYNRLKNHVSSLPRMDAADALALRVHPAISLGSARPRVNEPKRKIAGRLGWRCKGAMSEPFSIDPDLPLFVPREKFDLVCRALIDSAKDGGFLLLVGDSSVGKTRLLYEASRKTLPNFALLAPDLGDGELVNRIANADFKIPPVVIWLDEFQRFLDGPYLTAGHTSITAAAIRKLLEAPSPVVIVATLWPEYAHQLRSTEFDVTHGLQRPRYPSALDILDDRRLTEISLDSFTPEERREAARLAPADPRLLLALENPDYNLTEVLSGALEIVRRYERGTKEQRAIVDAAVDARRLGIQGPLDSALLLSASRAYLTGYYPDDSWFQSNLDELTSADRPQDRGTAPVIVITSADRRTVLGYSITDFLLQRLSKTRTSQAVPSLAWEALTAGTVSPYDQLRLADNAYEKGMAYHAESLYRKLVEGDSDNWQAARRLSSVLIALGHIDELSMRADNGDRIAAEALVGLLVSTNRIGDALVKLRLYAQAGETQALQRLAAFLEFGRQEQEAIDVLKKLTSRGDLYAERRLLQLLVANDRMDEAALIVKADKNWSWLGAYGLGHLKKAVDD